MNRHSIDHMNRESVSFGGCEDIKEKKELSAFDALKYLCNRAEGCQLSSKFRNDEKVKQCLATLKTYLPFSDNQIILFSIISAYTLGKGSVYTSDVGNKLDVSPFIMFELQKELDDLEQRNYISIDEDNFGTEEYNANMDVLKSLRDGVIPDKPQGIIFRNNLEMIRYIGSNLFSQRYFGKMHELLRRLDVLFRNNSDLDMVKKMNFYKLTTFEKNILLLTLDYLIVYNENLSFEALFRFEGAKKTECTLQIKEYLTNQKNPLFNLHFLEIVEGEFIEDSELKITEKAISTFFPKEKKIFMAKTKNGKADTNMFTIIKPSDIKEKKLIYDEKTRVQVQTLKDILDVNGLKKLQKNLISNGLRSGVNVLLYGFPGTGKTETVLQLCRLTKRIVFQINISEMKSMWYGQSEKIVNSLFTQYNSLMKTSSRTPILLFNEADGVLSKRRDLASAGNCGQTENAIQNILLQAFESNEGIIICTTNMIDNLDQAFARRFLYKIEFIKPDTKVRMELIKLKLGKYLSDDDCTKLASNYEVTGGTLDNIMTKIIAQQCLYNTLPSSDEIESYMQQDFLGNSRHAVGFGRN
jgi:AAA+ superfamily predicted ATPase